MVDIIMGVWMQLFCLKCVESEKHLLYLHTFLIYMFLKTVLDINVYNVSSTPRSSGNKHHTGQKDYRKFVGRECVVKFFLVQLQVFS